MEAEIRKEKIVDGKTYISVNQVVQDYISNRNNKTEDANFELVNKIHISYDQDSKFVQDFFTEDIDHEIVEQSQLPLSTEDSNNDIPNSVGGGF